MEIVEVFRMKYKNIISQYTQKWDSFYLYDESRILESTAHLKANFPHIHFIYSIKCNANAHVLRCIFQQGFGADAASLGEVLLAYKAGLSGNSIYYSAPGKSINDIEKSITKAILIADSIEEIKRIQTVAERLGMVVSIGIRINPDFSFAGEGGKPSKFGIDEKKAIEFIKSNPCKNIKITGIHIHIKSQELDANVLSAYYKRVFLLAKKVSQLCGSLDYINMGSGMGVAYAATDVPLDLYRIRLAIEQSLNEFRALYPAAKIIIEVGRYAVCKSGYYVTKVMDRKESYGKTYLILKNTLNGFLRPSLAKLVAQYSDKEASFGTEPLFTSVDAFSFLSFKKETNLEKVSLVGNLCTAADVIAEDILMPRLECGDVVMITNAGSYGAVLSPFQFSAQQRPVELFLTQNGEIIEA